MHEVAIAHNICNVVRPHTNARQQLTKVVVVCGPFCGVVPDALQFSFGIVAESELGVSPQLEIRVPPADATCPSCDHRFGTVDPSCICPECGHRPVTVTGGRELQVKEIEVDDV